MSGWTRRWWRSTIARRSLGRRAASSPMRGATASTTPPGTRWASVAAAWYAGVRRSTPDARPVTARVRGGSAGPALAAHGLAPPGAVGGAGHAARPPADGERLDLRCRGLGPHLGEALPGGEDGEQQH